MSYQQYQLNGGHDAYEKDGWPFLETGEATKCEALYCTKDAHPDSLCCPSCTLEGLIEDLKDDPFNLELFGEIVKRRGVADDE